ncbi:glycosyltransferase family 4 protein [Staphylococcus saprophyticus]|uniref:glycosyltransferase family 4 protein n=1 Tax=Staphylococcus saprophyticus TaxID=29385 RepID=UPI00297B020F|nr:glycosyltransferase family 4 protein [Staphylococcus saprophyticus]
MKNILIISQYYNPEPFLINEVVESLKEKGYKLTVLTGVPNYPEGEIYKGYKAGITEFHNKEIIRVNARPRKKGKINLFLNYISFAFKGSIEVMKMKDKYDVLYVYQLSPVLMAIPAILYKLRFKKKIVLYCLDLWPQSLVSGGIKNSSAIYKMFLIISKYIYKKIDIIQISSSLFEKYFREELNIKKKLNYVPQYANDLFLFPEKKINIKIGSENVNLMFAGNLGEMQSIETVIKAINLMTYKKVKLHILGEGSNKESLIQFVNELNLGDRVLFYGRKPMESMPSYYQKADALIVSLKKDEIISYTLPGKVQSYMASGKPLIGSIDGEASNIINEANCGLVSQAEDSKSLAENFDKFCYMEQKEKERLGENGKNFYKENFTKEIFMNSLIKDLKGASK